MYPPHHLGGYELSCQDVIGRWRSKGHRVVVLTSDLRLDKPHTQTDEPDVHRDLHFYWKDHEILRPPWRERLRIERWNQDRIKSAFDEFKPDVVSAWNMGAMSLGLLETTAVFGIPLVLVVCDDWLIHGPIIDAWTHLFRKSRLIARAARKFLDIPTFFDPASYEPSVCFVSNTIRERATKHAGWEPKRWTVAYTGIDLADFPVREPPVRLWSWKLLYVGRVEERKGVHVAIEALARLPKEATLSIAGPIDDRYLPRLKGLLNDLDLANRVSFINRPRTELPEVYTEADAFLFPVLWDEPFGLVPVESMACATPVVATGTGGSKEFLIDGVNCLIVPPGDAAALSAAIERLASDDALRARIIGAGRLTAQKLTVDEYADVLETWHRAAAGGFSDGVPPARPRLEEALATLRPHES